MEKGQQLPLNKMIEYMNHTSNLNKQLKYLIGQLHVKELIIEGLKRNPQLRRQQTLSIANSYSSEVEETRDMMKSL